MMLAVLNLSSYALGLVFILLVAIIWSAASIVVQYLYHNQSFNAPFLLTYIGISLFVVQLPLHWMYKRWVKWQKDSGDHNYESVPVSPHSLEEEEELQQTVGDVNGNNSNMTGENLWTEKDHMIAAAKLAPWWFVSNFSYNASLQYTSITSSTVLVNTGSLFTFLFALLMRDEYFSYLKLLGIFFGMTGCILTGIHDAVAGGSGKDDARRLFLFGDGGGSNDNNLSVWGDSLSVISAVFYGVYAVMVRVLCPRDESLMSMQLFLGYVGLWNMLALSPIAIYQLGIAKNVTMSAWIFSCLVVKGLFDNVLSDYLWARSVILTSATVATVGLGLTIPLAFVSDVFMGVEDVVNVESILGAGFVLFGFILVNVGQKKQEEESMEDGDRSSINEEECTQQGISIGLENLRPTAAPNTDL